MNLIIAGSRGFSDDSYAHPIIDHLHAKTPFTSVICGMARGADLVGKRWAESRGIPVQEFPADWKRYRNAAGPIRNEQMAEVADAVLVFWDGASRGSRHMADIAKALNLKLCVVMVNQ